MITFQPLLENHLHEIEQMTELNCLDVWLFELQDLADTQQVHILLVGVSTVVSEAIDYLIELFHLVEDYGGQLRFFYQIGQTDDALWPADALQQNLNQLPRVFLHHLHTFKVTTLHHSI